MKIENTEQEMMEIFLVVERTLEIISAQVSVIIWQNSKDHVFAWISDRQPVCVCKRSWGKISSYAGFETREEAEKFVEAQKAKK